MSWLNRLAERRMQAARLKGQLQGLAGEGKPLPDRTGDAFITPGEAVGFRIMAEAGVLPEEIILKKQAAAARAHPPRPDRQCGARRRQGGSAHMERDVETLVVHPDR